MLQINCRAQWWGQPCCVLNEFLKDGMYDIFWWWTLNPNKLK
jgi:hypothetical protein